MSGKRINDLNACRRAYSFALELFDKYVRLPSAPNAHYGTKGLYTGLMQLTRSGENMGDKPAPTLCSTRDK